MKNLSRRKIFNKLITLLSLTIVIFSLLGCKKMKDGIYATINTTKGEIVVKLEYEKTPMTVCNFIGLAEGIWTDGNKPFYNGLTFHRVIDNFMIQTGCPYGTGTGGPGYKFPDEFDKTLRHNSAGILSMANAGPNTNGSQFFITHKDTEWLDDKHTVFGKVVEGQDVVNKIKQGDKINKITIKRVGKDAENFVVSKEKFEEYKNKLTKINLEKLKEQNKKTLETIDKLYPKKQTNDSGLMVVVEKEGDKKGSPKYGQSVTVHYTGKLLDGTIFDSSIKRGTPATFKIGEVIEGWNEALLNMTKGEKVTLIIPPNLGYGEMGYPGVIPPNSYLIFNIELIDF